MPAEARQIETPPDRESLPDIEAPVGDGDLARTVLDAHGGDALAALRSVIADAAFLHEQLETVSLCVSPGLVRGWKPKFQREGEG